MRLLQTHHHHTTPTKPVPSAAVILHHSLFHPIPTPRPTTLSQIPLPLISSSTWTLRLYPCQALFNCLIPYLIFIKSYAKTGKKQIISHGVPLNIKHANQFPALPSIIPIGLCQHRQPQTQHVPLRPSSRKPSSLVFPSHSKQQ
jgi:hypothetical protein